jgi:hypothetical protein
MRDSGAERRIDLKFPAPAQIVHESSMMGRLFGLPEHLEGMMTASSQSHIALMRWKKADLAEEVLALRRELDASREDTEPIDAAVADALPGANLLSSNDRSGLWPVLEGSPVGVSMIRPKVKSSISTQGSRVRIGRDVRNA